MGEREQTLYNDLYDLESTALLEFFQVFPDYINNPDLSINVFGGTNGTLNPIIWQGVTYIPLAIESGGFEIKGDKSLPRPKLRIGNTDLLISQYLKMYGSFDDARVVRKRVFLKYLDAANFVDNLNPFGNPDPNMGFPDEVFYIYRKTLENQSIVEFELVSSLELENISIPRRIVLASYCPFAYRGECCGYKSDSQFFDENDNAIVGTTLRGQWAEGQSYNANDIVYKFTRNKINITPSSNLDNANGHESPSYARAFFVCRVAHTSTASTNPSQREDLWYHDVCSKSISGCKARFGNTIRFGGFPGTDGFGRA